MGLNSTPTKWSQYNPEQLDRVTYSRFQGSGIDLFTDPVDQNPARFTQLTNVIPSPSGGFGRRWGFSVATNVGGHDINRLHSYTAKADTSFAGTVDTAIVLGSESGTGDIFEVYSDLTPPTFNLSRSFFNPGQIYSVTSRQWFYAMNGADQPKKVNYSQHSFDTFMNWGFNPPASRGISTDTGVGHNFTTPTVTGTDGFGTGATFLATVSLDAFGLNGLITAVQVTAPGSGYMTNFTLTVTDPSGALDAGVVLTAVVETDSTLVDFGQVVGVMFNGPLILNGGRTYAIAFQNSVTGHTSDFVASTHPARYFLAPTPTQGAAFTNLGMSRIRVTIGFDVAGVDPQVDTVVLLATSDGGDLEHLYEVTTIPLASFFISAGIYNFIYMDSVPDTYNDIYVSGATLLTQNLWVDTDPSGNLVGIALNTPPQFTLSKPILHKNRLFATDGRSVYFSKSLGEVTTSTGLITSKFEEAWPGDNVLDVAYGNETITALLSDGDILYIGTTENIYRLFGSSSADFSIPASIFRGVGVASYDTWTVIYKDNIPAGYTWTTSDNKIMLSDFNTYTEIGQPIYPLLNGISIGFVQSISYGPYSFALYSIPAKSDGSYVYYVFDTKNGGWYEWLRPASPSAIPGQTPALLNFTLASGIERMFTLSEFVSPNQYLLYFDPTATLDGSFGGISAAPIPWMIQTGWQDMGDNTATKVLNEIELWTDDPFTRVAVYLAQTPADFASPVTVRSSAQFVYGPLGTQKFYLAGYRSRGRYYSFQFGVGVGQGNSQAHRVLSMFSAEFYPMGRQ
jgi:hypothetical protein